MHRRSFRWTLLAFVLTSGRLAAQVPTLSTADSLSLATSAARASIGGSPTAPACVTHIMTSLQNAVGQAFVTAGEAHARSLAAAGDSAATQEVNFAGFRGTDTVTVLLTFSGSTGSHMWENFMDYSFIRGTAAGSWRLVARRLARASDYVVTSPATRRRTCLNDGGQSRSPSP